MTKDEAIRILENAPWLKWAGQATVISKEVERVREAEQMAIDTLKAQLTEKDTTSDCISRHALISTILGMTTFGNVHELNKFVHKCHLDGAHMGGLRDAILAVVNAPSVQPDIIYCKD